MADRKKTRLSGAHFWVRTSTPCSGEIFPACDWVAFSLFVSKCRLEPRGGRRGVFLAACHPGWRERALGGGAPRLRLVELEHLGPGGLRMGGAAGATEEHQRGHEGDAQVEPQRGVADVELVEPLLLVGGQEDAAVY